MEIIKNVTLEKIVNVVEPPVPGLELGGGLLAKYQ